MPSITPDNLIPDIVAQFPACRAVLDRYGMRGCGGPLGPHETLRFFAEAHGVNTDQLLRELNAAAQAPQNASSVRTYTETIADQIYRPFFKTAILITLTAGCTWGAVNLFHIGRRSNFFAVPLDWTLAHAHAQIAGWVGLFIMGFALQAFPRFRQTQLSHPLLAVLSFWLMLAGLTLHTVAQTWSQTPAMLPLGLFSGALELVAVTLFLGLIFQTMHKGAKTAPTREKMVGGPFIMTALLAFWLQTALGIPLFWKMATAASEMELVRIIVTWMPPYRDLQFFGFIVMMIFGVSLRLLPGVFGLGVSGQLEDETIRREHSIRIARRIYRIFALSVVLDIACAALRNTTHSPWFVYGSMASYLGLLIAGVMLVRHLGVFGPAANPDRSLKFIRAAYGWLLVALVLRNGMFPYNWLTGQSFSHAYLGSVRHALTVGFISLMIMGVAARVVPTLRGIDTRALNALWLPFLLLNLGNGLRVATEITTDFTRAAFPIMGISGFFEVTALLLWGMDVWQTMHQPATASRNLPHAGVQPDAAA